MDAGQPAAPVRPSRVHATPVTALATLPQLRGAWLALPDDCDPGDPARPVAVTGISSASSAVRPGDLFAALPGSSGHGARFAAHAVRSGAVAVLTDAGGLSELGPELGVPALVVDHPRDVLGAVAAEIYGHPADRLRVVGITGTSGKTTTTFLVRAGLRAAGDDVGLIGTVGVFVGEQSVKTAFTTPEADQLQGLLAAMAEHGLDTVAMEVSSHALRMGRVNGIRFSVGAFTNLSQDHLDFHSDMEDYFQAKALLFDGRAAREVVVIDDQWGRRLIGPGRVTVTTRPDATGDGADWWVSDVAVEPDGSTRFTVHGPAGRSFPAGCRIPGAYNIANTVLALAVLSELGVDAPAVAPAVARAQVRGRMERVDGDQPFLAVVDYSHKPAGVSSALLALRPLTRGRLIIVLGCGGDRDRGKRPLMGEVAARDADILVVTDDNPRSEDPAEIRAAMLAGARAVPAADRAEVIEEGKRRRAIERAVGLARPGDTVLIAGKGHETGQQVGADMLPFDDVTVVAESLAALGYRPAAAEFTAGPAAATGREQGEGAG